MELRSVAAVRALTGLARARIGGKIVAANGRSALVEDWSGALWAVGAEIPPVGAWVVVEGAWNGDRLDGARFEVRSDAPLRYPSHEGDWNHLHADERRRLGHLVRRADIIRAARAFFEDRGFLEVETPLMVPSPGLDLHLDAFEVKGVTEPRWLITSPEYQMKRLLSAGLPRIFQLCKCFRGSERGPIHQPEFTMLEWYRSFAGSHEVMRDTEELIAHLAERVGGDGGVIETTKGPIRVTPPWDRITVAEAFQRHAGLDVNQILPDEDRFFLLFAEAVQPKLGADRPVFVVDWPPSMASLARIDPEGGADRFEAFVQGVELCNGFGELTDPSEQRVRLTRDQEARASLGKPVYPIDERFLGALEDGIPEAGGNALGFDRLVMLLLGAETISDVISVPGERL